MPCLLHIETSAAICSVALSVDGEVRFAKASHEGRSHASLLGVYVEEALGVVQGKPDAIAVSAGPGSFTGLRIGVSLAKGLCFGFGVPLIAVPTLEIVASKALKQTPHDEGALFCALLDARRTDVYAALYDANGRLVREPKAETIATDTYVSFLQAHTVYFVGDGAAKCREVIVSPRAVFLDGLYPLAVDMIPLADERFRTAQFEDVAYFEPFYLKAFTPTVPKNKVIQTAQ